MKILGLDHVSKRYRLRRLKSQSLREELAGSARRLLRGGPSEQSDEFYALRDVSLAAEQGETLGIIGPNGSGKSTILKLLAHITYPTSGQVAVLGSVTSLIDIGAGLHPELTGRENVYLYGSIMGMRRAEVREKFDRIVDFAELREFIDTPVKRYSSGMYVRLGFAVAAHINPQVLLVDEVLAVGDALFRSKCLQRIEELRRGGTTIVYVSHNMPTVERLCHRVLFLHEGRIRSEGEPQNVIAEYYDTVFSSAAARDGSVGPQDAIEHGLKGVARITDVRLLNGEGREIDTLATGDPLIVQIDYRAHAAVEDPIFELFFYSVDGQLACHYTTALTGKPIPMLQADGIVEIDVDEVGLMPGLYTIDAVLARRRAVDPYDLRPRLLALKVLPGKKVRGLFYSPHRWRVLPSREASSEALPT